MSDPEFTSVSYDRLRALAATDPKQARLELQMLLAGPLDVVNQLLAFASRPGESRVRQVIAVAARLDASLDQIGPHLTRWLDIEADEFTRRAIESALAERPAAARPETSRTSRAPAQPSSLEMYRYVAERLCHRVRNAVASPNAQLLRLERSLARVADPAVRAEFAEIHGALRSGFMRVNRAVQFDLGDDYMSWKPVCLGDWLNGIRIDFGATLGAATLTIVGTPDAERACVRTTRFLLETAFGNIWANAVQAVGTSCAIVMSLSMLGEDLEIIVSDDGPGFEPAVVGVAFQQSFSTRAGTRGRGLLEVADSVSRMHGYVELAEVRPAEYRMRILLPVERS